MGISGEPHSGTADELFERHHISAASVTRQAVAAVS
jgi:hypothetical protein